MSIETKIQKSTVDISSTRITKKSSENSRKKLETIKNKTIYAVGAIVCAYLALQPSMDEKINANDAALSAIAVAQSEVDEKMVDSQVIPPGATRLEDIPKMKDTARNREKCIDIVNVSFEQDKTTEEKTFCIPKINPENQILLVKQIT